MADNKKKMVEQITSMDVDFAQWYTDVVKKAELVDYSGVKGCMIIRPYGYAIWENKATLSSQLYILTHFLKICKCFFAFFTKLLFFIFLTAI